jgi:hypothetical protein
VLKATKLIASGGVGRSWGWELKVVGSQLREVEDSAIKYRNK